MATVQDQLEAFFAKLQGGREAMMLDYEHGMILAVTGEEMPADPEEAAVATELFAAGASTALQSYFQAMKSAGIAAPLEENIQSLGDLYTLICPLESAPKVLLCGTISSEHGNVGMLRLQLREAAKSITLQ